MGYEEHERVQVKLEFLRMITRMKINPAQMMESNQIAEITKLSKEEIKKLAGK